MRSVPERGSACSSRSIKKEDDSSQSSTCVVDTTTQGCTEEAAAWKGLCSDLGERGRAAWGPRDCSPHPLLLCLGPWERKPSRALKWQKTVR